MMDEYKAQAVTINNSDHENPLFLAIRAGEPGLFDYFKPCGHQFFRARGAVNKHGQTIEHVACDM